MSITTASGHTNLSFDYVLALFCLSDHDLLLTHNIQSFPQVNMAGQNHYAVLGVKREATHSEIKTAYTNLVLSHHPDKGGTQALFVLIQAAWELLRDKSAREKFDRENVFATGVPGKPQFAASSSAAGGVRDGKENPTSNAQPFDERTGPHAKPTANPWNEFRESAGGKAYNRSKNTTEKGSSKSSRTKQEYCKTHRANQNETSAHEDIPMGDSTEAPTPEGACRDQHQHEETKHNNRNARGRSRTPSPGRGRWSPPTPPADYEIKGLADQAEKTLIRYRDIVKAFRASTAYHSREYVTEEIQIKLQHVHSFLSVRKLKLKLRIHDESEYNADVRANSTPKPLEPFFASLMANVLSGDVDVVSDLDSAMNRVQKDMEEMLRMKKLLLSKGLKLKTDDKALSNLQSSTAALGRLLTNILLNTPEVGPSMGYS